MEGLAGHFIGRSRRLVTNEAGRSRFGTVAEADQPTRIDGNEKRDPPAQVTSKPSGTSMGEMADRSSYGADATLQRCDPKAKGELVSL